MSPDRKIEAEKIHIVTVRTLSGSIEGSFDQETNEVAGYSFGFELATAVNAPQKMVGLKLVVSIATVDKQDNPLPAKGAYTHEMIFRVENLDDFIEKEEGKKIRIDPVLGSTLVGIFYSTVRGIIFSRTQGTPLKEVVLPVIAPLKLMKIENETKKAK